MNILKIYTFSKIFFDFFFIFFAFFNSEKKALQVKEKCVSRQGKVCQGSRMSALGGQGEVRQGSRRSASRVKGKCLC